MRRFKALAAKHSRLCETYVTESSATRNIASAKFVAGPRGVCNFLTVSRVREALSKRFALKLIENEVGRTASEDRQRGIHRRRVCGCGNLVEVVTPEVVLRRRHERFGTKKST
jgi:hypothetical protein